MGGHFEGPKRPEKCEIVKMTRTSKMKVDICSVIVQSFRPEILAHCRIRGLNLVDFQKIIKFPKSSGVRKFPDPKVSISRTLGPLSEEKIFDFQMPPVSEI